MQDLRVAGLAVAATIAAIVDTLIPTPEDLYPWIGWVDEAMLWGLSFRLWMSYAEGRKLEELFTPAFKP